MQVTGVNGHLILPPRALTQVLHAPSVMEIEERGKGEGLMAAVSPKSFRLQRFSAL